MKKAKIYNFGVLTGFLIAREKGYSFIYDENYSGEPISLTMPLEKKDFFL